MRQFRNRLAAVALGAGVALMTGCGKDPPTPTPHQAGSDGGMARPHGDAPPKAGKKAPPRLDE